MKNIIRAAALVLVVSAMLASCNSSQQDNVQKDTAGSTTATERTTRTNSMGFPIPDVLKDESVEFGPEPEAENPITEKNKAQSYHNSHSLISFVKGSGKYYNFNPWDDGKQVESLFDGKDGYFNTKDQSKLGGIVSKGELVLEFRTEKATLVGYALVTGNDSKNFSDRNPGEWTLSGSNDGKNWTVLDYVYDGNITASDHQYFGYEIDDDVKAEYSYYQFRFTSDIYYAPVTSLQLNELYLYKDKN